jgi:chromodomain-helicase-DNA-binding protein 7
LNFHRILFIFQFCEEDIDSILERRAKTITIEGNKAGGSFSKATFASAETTDINLDDPDFWNKWAKKAEIEQIDENTKLMMVEPRSRKKTTRLFEGHEGLDPRQVSELDSSDDSDGAGGLTGRAGKNRKSNRNSRRRPGYNSDEDYMEDERDVEYGSWSKSELFRMEKSVLTFGYVVFTIFFKSCWAGKNLVIQVVKST